MKQSIIDIIQKVVGSSAVIELSVPEEVRFGHYATNVAMRLAKARGKVPLALAEELAEQIAAAAPAGFFERVEAAPPGFVNFWLSRATIQDTFAAIARREDFGRSDEGRGATVIVEYSQPNVAKMMHVGHLRTTIIGDALANILDFLGYRVVRWNYLGDWGTQFGKLIVAYKLWPPSAGEMREHPIATLQALYVRFHDEAKKDPQLDARGQEEFKKLEQGDRENRDLWKRFVGASLDEFKKTYQALGIDFSGWVWIGESFFERELAPLVEEMISKEVARESEGAIVVPLEESGLPPALIRKADGASLYLTRDIANLKYRLKEYHPEKILYVVGNEQSLHFEQLFAVAKIVKLDSADLEHVKYGLVLGEAGKKLATREGRTVLLADVLGRATSLARAVVEEKNKELPDEEKDEIAKAVAIGALKYNDLKENRMTDIVFDWERMLDLTGDSGPYLQYSYARLMSILRKAGASDGDLKGGDASQLGGEEELVLMRKIFEFPDTVRTAGGLYATSILANYLYKLAIAANRFYETTRILNDENEGRRKARLLLAATAARTLAAGLDLLGIRALPRV